MPTLRLVLGDQLSHSLTALQNLKAGDAVLMCEVMEEASYVKHHPKKIAFLFSAMRHFAEELREKGVEVRYVKLDDPQNSGTLDGEVQRAFEGETFSKLMLTEPGEWRVLEKFKAWQKELALPVVIRDDERFMCSIAEFKAWADGRKQLRMEFFYREMRKGFSILTEKNGNPVGGKWNYDSENRKPPKEGLSIPKRISHEKDAITNDVLKLVEARFSNHFGDLLPFHFAVTRNQALTELNQFIDEMLVSFGDYQDAMLTGEPYMYHSLISSYLNAGLLEPLEICRMAEHAYHAGKAPLNAVEGFIRQIMGWREYVRGLYWLKMPDYADLNFFSADRPLPAFYWGAPTKMDCLAEAVRHTREHAYSHHIQRLMVTGNFALLAGIAPAEVCEWYLAVYADAYEWVELPNTLGMALFGDGGIMASKPYAASGKYINKMSNFCSGCAFNPEEMLGETACPFNALYWDFIARNEGKLKGNQRLNYTFAGLNAMKPEKRQAIRAKAADTLQALERGQL
jgi:deoxyribodipyrimidine photolyase-related protein